MKKTISLDITGKSFPSRVGPFHLIPDRIIECEVAFPGICKVYKLLSDLSSEHDRSGDGEPDVELPPIIDCANSLGCTAAVFLDNFRQLQHLQLIGVEYFEGPSRVTDSTKFMLPRVICNMDLEVSLHVGQEVSGQL